MCNGVVLHALIEYFKLSFVYCAEHAFRPRASSIVRMVWVKKMSAGVERRASKSPACQQIQLGKKLMEASSLEVDYLQTGHICRL